MKKKMMMSANNYNFSLVFSLQVRTFIFSSICNGVIMTKYFAISPNEEVF